MPPTNRGPQPSSEEPYEAPASPAYAQDVAIRLHLGEILESINEESTSIVPLQGQDLELHRLLSIHNVVSTSSSNIKQQSLVQATSNRKFSKIGAGACGAIFAQEGKSNVLKLAKTTDISLWNDYIMHTLIYEKIKLYKLVIKVPECYFYVPREGSKSPNGSDFLDKYPALVEAARDVCNLPTKVLVTERINPLPETTRMHLINKYCSSRIKAAALEDPANKDCLVRVYLGSLEGKAGGMFFSLRNFKLHLNHMIELQLDVCSMATEMGRSLAVMHWVARTDARDVEYVLGSSAEQRRSTNLGYAQLEAMEPETYTGPPSGVLEDFFHRTTELWLLDFNLVRRIELNEECIDHLVDAFKQNDPYFPKPLQDHPVAKRVWNQFVEGYLEIATIALRNEEREIQELPLLFLRRLVNEKRGKLEGKRGQR